MNNNYEEIAGTYWLCRNKDNTLWLTQGNKPLKMFDFYSRNPDKQDDMNWLQIGDEEGNIICRSLCLINKPFNKELIKELKLPKVTWEDGPLEIEITKSGKVYWYES